MRLFFQCFTCLVLMISPLKAHSQNNDTISLTLNEAIEIAQRQSLNAFIAKNTYLEGYWDFKTYRSTLYPSLNLNSTLFQYYVGNEWLQNDQKFQYRENTFNQVGLSLEQNIVPTGGTISLNTYMQQRNKISNPDSIFGPMDYETQPFFIAISQPLTGYNEFKEAIGI